MDCPRECGCLKKWAKKQRKKYWVGTPDHRKETQTQGPKKTSAQTLKGYKRGRRKSCPRCAKKGKVRKNKKRERKEVHALDQHGTYLTIGRVNNSKTHWGKIGEIHYGGCKDWEEEYLWHLRGENIKEWKLCTLRGKNKGAPFS